MMLWVFYSSDRVQVSLCMVIERDMKNGVYS